MVCADALMPLAYRDWPRPRPALREDGGGAVRPDRDEGLS